MQSIHLLTFYMLVHAYGIGITMSLSVCCQSIAFMLILETIKLYDGR